MSPDRTSWLLLLPLLLAPSAAPSPMAARRSAMFRVLQSSELASSSAFTRELNDDRGHDLSPGTHLLPGGDLRFDCPGSVSNVTLYNQLGQAAGGRLGEFGMACGVDTPTPDPATTTRLVFEGRTQVLTALDDGEIPVLGPTTFQRGPDAGDPIFFDSDSGPPDHPELDTTATSAFQTENPEALLDLEGRQVTFGPEAGAYPLDLGIQGRVRNLPVQGPVRGEVGATVAVAIERADEAPVRGLPGLVQVFTGPLMIDYSMVPAPSEENPSYDGEANAPGAFRLPLDFSAAPDGEYLLRFLAQDVQGNASPSDGEALVVRVVVARGR